VSADNRYQAAVDDDRPNTSHIQICALLERHCEGPLRILEVGCSSGYMGAHLKARGHSVVGVEPSPAAAEAARVVLDEVHVGTFAQYACTHRPGSEFDVVTFVDVLEHLDDPAEALRQCVTLLKPDGHIAISIPNVTHGGIRGLLLEGRWEYQELGILDRTHLRFFSRQSFVALLDAAGLGIVDLRRTTMSTQEMSRAFELRLAQSTVDLVESASRDDDLDTFQFIALVRVMGSDDAARTANAPWHDAALTRFGDRRSPARRRYDALRRRLRAIARLAGLTD
jgi:O-antigen biosynthesis protein